MPTHNKRNHKNKPLKKVGEGEGSVREDKRILFICPLFYNKT